MSGTVANRKRLLRVTAGNLRNDHIYVAGHYDFFPTDCIGASRRSDNGNGHGVPIAIQLTGLKQTVETDIGTDSRTGKPRRMFRGRQWVREFFEKHAIQPGDVLALERLDERRYRLYPFSTAADRKHDWHTFLQEPPPGRGPTVLELFAGCGGMALGFKQAGFRAVLAVEWDADACETLRKNVTGRVAQCAIEEIEKFPSADVVVGGPPCQGFSNLGEKVPYDPRRQLWRHFMRAVQDSGPSAFVMDDGRNP